VAREEVEDGGEGRLTLREAGVVLEGHKAMNRSDIRLIILKLCPELRIFRAFECKIA
jgi:hypothetical protein